jgi:hypothetical protein
MKEYLEAHKGQKLGIIRAGMPKEVYFEATVNEVAGGVVILKNDSGQEIALPLDKILLIGPPEPEAESDKVGFRP